MTREQKLAAILAAIQDNEKLFSLLRTSVAKNIVNVEDGQLDLIMQLLGIVNG